MIGVQPIEDRVIVLVMEEDEVVNGLYIPDVAKEKPQEGIVQSVGQGKFNTQGVRTPLDVQNGERVLFSKYSGTELVSGGVKYLVLKHDELLAVRR
jgi:chaperonin GroES